MGKRLGALIGAIVSIVLVGPGSADAATFDVDSTADATHVGGCTAAPDDCSIRDAVAAVNASLDTANTINVPGGTYSLTAGQLDLAPLLAGANTTITGAGARDTKLDAGGLSRVFAITAGATAISGVTITGGLASDTGATPEVGDGGGIVIVGSGVGDTPSLTLTDSTVTNNTAAFNGGGIAAPSFHTGFGTETEDVSIVRSTISNNHLTGGTVPFAAIGAGIGTYGNLTVTNSTITGNTTDNLAAINMGGGIGAGIDPSNTGPTTVAITNSTISGNAANGAPTSTGGGLAIPSSSPSVSMSVVNTIIHGNSVNGADSDCFGVVAPTSKNNLTGDASCLFADAGSFQADPQLADLANNGGPTDTLLPAEGSPAIDAGDLDACPATDQRGVTRPQRGGCDIGAVELEVVPVPPTPTPKADLTMSIKATPASPKLGDKVKFALTVKNAGPDTANGVVLTGKLPAPGSRIVPPDGCTVKKFKPSPIPKRKLTCQLGALDSGASATRKVKVKPGEQTQAPRATAQVTSAVSDPNPANNVDKLKVDVRDKAKAHG
jgi:uncharacterized repeat protein (TIGR01451 family)